MRKVMSRLKLIQLDAVPVVTRAQYMPFFSRLGPYRAKLLDETAYAHDEWFEAWAHEASLLPTSAEPLLRWSKQRARAGKTWRGLVRVAKDEALYVQAVLDEVADRGPVRTSQLSDPRPRAGEWWGSRSLGQLALDWLFRIGAVGVRRSPSFEKEFDLLERIVPEEILARQTPSHEEAMGELLCQGAAAHGVATANDLVDYFRLPGRPAKALLPKLVEDGRLIECNVEGWDKLAYRHPRATLARKVDACALVSPFDPVVWNRDRALRLFDFHYRIEIYVPKAKRVYGYYVLPLLLGDQLVGRFDLKTDRSRRVLEVRGSYLEQGQSTGRVAEAAATALRDLAIQVGADSVEVSLRGNLAAAIRPLV